MKKLLKFLASFMTKKTGFMVLTVALAILVLPEIADAVDPVSNKQQEVEQELAVLVSMVIKTLNTFLWPFLLVVGELMDNDLITGPGMEDRLLGIWVEIRNLVNIVFAVVLLVIAFYNALPISSSEGNLALKTALPKVVIGLILVNFTFLAGKVVLDVTNVATTAAFALPELVDGFDFEDQEREFEENVCMKSDKSLWNENADPDSIPVNTKLFCEFNETTKDYGPELTEFISNNYFQNLNINNVSIVMAVNMGGLESLGLLKPEAVTSFQDLVINGIFSLVMYVIFAVTFIVLGIVLLTRIVVMWVVLALSPIGVLFYVVPQLKDAVSGGGGDIVGKITKQLLAPVIIGITMSIGFLMMAALSDVGGSFQEFANVQADELLTSDFLISGISDMERFIISIATVVIVWTGVFAAANGAVSGAITEQIGSFGQRVGGALAKAPLLIPTVPVFTKDGSKSQGVSPLALMTLANTSLNNFGVARMNTQLEGTRFDTSGLPKTSETLSHEVAARISDRKIPLSGLKTSAREIFNSLKMDKGPERDKVESLLKQIQTSSTGSQAHEHLKVVISKTTAEQLNIGHSVYESLRTLEGVSEVAAVGAGAAGAGGAAAGGAAEGGGAGAAGSIKANADIELTSLSEDIAGVLTSVGITKVGANQSASELKNGLSEQNQQIIEDNLEAIDKEINRINSSGSSPA